MEDIVNISYDNSSDHISDNSILVRHIRIGEGIPKICVPLVAKTEEDIVSAVETIMNSEPDMIEFRADYMINYICKETNDAFNGYLEKDTEDSSGSNTSCIVEAKKKLIKALEIIRDHIGDKVLLFTIRTKGEGGEADINVDDYIEINQTACESGYIDLVDVEAFIDKGTLAKLGETARSNGVYVVGSNHDFHKTPDEEEILRRLKYMGDNGADIVKIAVMPNLPEDVLTLLSATIKYRRLTEAKPVITMSMGSIGVISRLSGESFGAAVTFAAAGVSSAPGQLPVDEVRNILKVLHKY